MNQSQVLIRELSIETKLGIAVIAILLVLLFAPVLVELVGTWSTNDDYSHGFFVMPIAAYMVWERRRELISALRKPVWFGLPIFLIGVVLYCVGFLSRFHTLIAPSMITIILGLILFLTGWKPTKQVLLPVLFLLFMFPIPAAYYVLITNPLKLMITKISAEAIQMVGIPVYREGNLLALAHSQLEVSEACSGVRSLSSYLMLGCLFVLKSKSGGAKLILMICAILLAILVNIVRVSGNAILSYHSGSEFVLDSFHGLSGIVALFFGFIVLCSLSSVLNAKAGIESDTVGQERG
jgi:exosortase